ncbi:uncharacterized protein LOC142468191 isoform X2 [Ascaphus truei]|uniref:uncharacterized protein LOC142468191 isoform X2 n=1 Tax=Ascaphus truei TaxID=8439 RepID=UPI003F5ABFD1
MDGAIEKKEASGGGSDLEGEDLLCRLTAEEKECLQYLLETINSLDAENQDDDDNVDTEQDSRGDFSNSMDAHREGSFDKNLKGLSEGAKVVDKTEHESSSSKMKITKCFSEDCPGRTSTVTPEVTPRSASTHPSHLRKFDTIMRSGVNVQELRARFIHHQDHSFFEDPSKESELSGASKQLPPISHNQKSPRQEALQKLGLLKRKV